METKVTKKQQVLDYLLQHKEITSWAAINMFGATRLSAIIFVLKKDGYDIHTVPQTGYDRYGNESNFAMYRLISTPQTSALRQNIDAHLQTKPTGAKTEKELRLSPKPNTDSTNLVQLNLL
jgi:hypothetical protein